MATLKVNCGGTASKSTARPVGEMRVENLYVFVGVVFPKLDRIFSADVNINPAARIVVFGVIGIPARIVSNGDEAVSEHPLVFAGKRFDELNDFVVNEEAILHDGWSSSERFNRRSNSSNVANSDAGLSIFSASFLR